jgi:uncharacterized protein (DUF427 family)
LEPTSRHLEVVFGGTVIADTRRGLRVLETSHPPVYYFPPADVRMEFMQVSDRSSYCEWKGRAGYYTIQVGDKVARDAAWFYPDPTAAFGPLKDYVAFYLKFMDRCLVDGETAEAQPGGFYGGWVTRDVVGPFKGSPGTMGW